MAKLDELMQKLNKVNCEILKIRRKVVYAEVAKRRKNHTINRLIEARLVCFESAYADGLIEMAGDELDVLEDLLGIELQG